MTRYTPTATLRVARNDRKLWFNAVAPPCPSAGAAVAAPAAPSRSGRGDGAPAKRKREPEPALPEQCRCGWHVNLQSDAQSMRQFNDPVRSATLARVARGAAAHVAAGAAPRDPGERARDSAAVEELPLCIVEVGGAGLMALAAAVRLRELAVDSAIAAASARPVVAVLPTLAGRLMLASLAARNGVECSSVADVEALEARVGSARSSATANAAHGAQRIGALLCSMRFPRMAAEPLFEALNFWFLKSRLTERGLLHSNASIAPRASTLVAALVSCPELWRTRAQFPVAPCGFAHESLRAVLRSELRDELPATPGSAAAAGGAGGARAPKTPNMATDEGRAECRRLSLPLHQYAHTLLSPPHDVLHLPFAASSPEEFFREPGRARPGRARTSVGQRVTVGGRAHAAVLWLKHDFGPHAGVLGAGCCADGSVVRHTVVFLREPVDVCPGEHSLGTTTQFLAETGALRIDAFVEAR